MIAPPEIGQANKDKVRMVKACPAQIRPEARSLPAAPLSFRGFAQRRTRNPRLGVPLAAEHLTSHPVVGSGFAPLARPGMTKVAP